ncbi:glycosyltransferase [Streptomyces sp. NBC_01431]|uniref:glycosyltransferase n=1 Tax=Streptomyces sp. NBC_01431 TaxID=2903863 RepID=UPI003FCC3004
MRILIATAGSRGDVAPYTGLGGELRRAGYDVALATTDAFAPLVREAGLALRHGGRRHLVAVPRRRRAAAH